MVKMSLNSFVAERVVSNLDEQLWEVHHEGNISWPVQIFLKTDTLRDHVAQLAIGQSALTELTKTVRMRTQCSTLHKP